MEPTKEQLAAMGLYAPPPPPPIPVADPGILQGSSPALPSSSLGGKIDPGMKIPADKMNSAAILGGHPEEVPQDEMHQAGKEAYHDSIPKISAMPGSADYYRQRQSQLDFKQAHPWGDEVSEHPGILGKIGHVAAKIGNIAGDAIIPGVMQNIPGTDLHNEVEEGRNERGITQGVENEEKEAQARNLNAQPELRQAKLDLDKEKQNEVADKNAGQEDVALRKLGLKKGADGSFATIPYSEMSPKEKALEDLKSAQSEAQEATAALKKSQADPNSPVYKLAQQRMQVALQNAHNASQRLGLSEEQFANKLQEQELVKPSGQSQSRGSAAQSVLNLIPDLKTLVEKHRADMGPVMGRLNRGEIAIGNVDPEVARLYTAMKSFYALQPAVHGFRNAEFVKDFEHAVGTLERNPDAFIAGMEGLKPTLESVATEGKTFHKRQVEGRDQPTPPKPAEPAGGVPSFAEWKARQK